MKGTQLPMHFSKPFCSHNFDVSLPNPIFATTPSGGGGERKRNFDKRTPKHVLFQHTIENAAIFCLFVLLHYLGGISEK